MADNVNFIPDDHHKKPQKREADIEYTEGEKNEKQAVSASLVNVEDAVKKTQSSFLAWRTARKEKREQAKKEKEEREAQERARAFANAQAKAAQQAAEEAKKKEAAQQGAAQKPAPQMKPAEQRPVPPPAFIATPKTEQKKQPAPKVERPHAPNISAPVAPRIERPQPAAIHRGEVQALPNDQITSVNLIPDSLIEDLKAQNRLRDLAIVAGLMCVLVMTAYSILTLYAQKLHDDTHDIVTTIGQLDEQIQSKEALRQSAQTQYDQLSAVQEIVHSHIEWSPFFNYIEQWTLPTVFYQNMSGSAVSGDFTFAAVTSDIRYVAEQVDTLRRSPAVTSVTTTSATQSTSDENSNSNTASSAVVEFTLTVHFNTSLFHAQVTSVNAQ